MATILLVADAPAVRCALAALPRFATLLAEVRSLLDR